MEYLSLLSLLISIGSIILAFFSFRRTRNLQDYDYAYRLQINDEQVYFGTPSDTNNPALDYSAKLVNKGTKPLKIANIYLDFGDDTNFKKRMKHHIEGEMYLRPDEKCKIEKEISWSHIEEMKKRFATNKVMFFLRVSYYGINGSLKSSSRSLGGFDGSMAISVVLRGDCLT